MAGTGASAEAESDSTLGVASIERKQLRPPLRRRTHTPPATAGGDAARLPARADDGGSDAVEGPPAQAAAAPEAAPPRSSALALPGFSEPLLILATGYVLQVVLVDLCVSGGLTVDSNSKWVSFLASVASCADFRAQKRTSPRSPRPVRSPNPPALTATDSSLFHAGAIGWAALTGGPQQAGRQAADAARVLVGNLWAKFGSATVGSLLVLETPVLLKGPRHLSTFVVALLLVQLCPRDAFYAALRAHKGCQLVVRLSAAVYKLRKLVFATLACRALARLDAARALFGEPGGLWHRGVVCAYAVLVAWVITDGNSNLRQVDNWLRWRGFPRSRHAGGVLQARLLLAQEAAAGLSWAVGRFANLAVLTILLVLLDAEAAAGANTAVRALALVVLLRRHRVDASLRECFADLALSAGGAARAASRRATDATRAATRLLHSLAPAAAESDSDEDDDPIIHW